MSRQRDSDLGPETDSRRVEAELEEFGDPEAGPTLPSTTLAAASVRRHDARGDRADAGPVGYAEILRLSWPVMLSQGLVALTGLVDRAMIGRVGSEAGAAVPLAAVGFATQLFFLIQSALFAVGLAAVALMARAIGAGDPDRSRAVFAASLEVALALAIGFSVPILLLGRWLLGLLGAEPAVIDAAIPYLVWVMGSSGMLALSLVLDSGLRANKDMRTPMWIAVVVAVVKLSGNWLLIYGHAGFPRLELVGAGLATAISQAVGLALFVWAVLRTPHESPVAVRWRHFRGASRRLRRDVVRIAVPGIGERVIMNFAMLSFFWVLSRYYGTLAVAAYTVGIALLSFSWIPGMAYSTSCATLVGQSLGAHDRRGAITAGWRSVQLAVVTAVAMGVLVAVTREELARLFTDDRAVIDELIPFMLALALIQPFLQAHFTLGGAHRGAGDTWTPLVAAAIGNWVFRVPVAILFAAVLDLSVLWIWFSLNLDHVARTAYLAWSFHRGRWADV